MSVNRVFLLGRVGSPPEARHTLTGLLVCNFSLATSRKSKDGTEKVQWHRLTAWGKVAEICQEYLKKGHQCYIEGEIDYQEYEKDGIKRQNTAINVQQVQLLERKPIDKANDEVAKSYAPSPKHDPRTFDDNANFGGTDFNGRKADTVNKNYTQGQFAYNADNIPF